MRTPGDVVTCATAVPAVAIPGATCADRICAVIAGPAIDANLTAAISKHASAADGEVALPNFATHSS